LSSLNHLTVPVAMFSSTADVLADAEEANDANLRALALRCRALGPTLTTPTVARRAAA
jgi:hypothetical protein